jgi:hypothetical protein
MTYMRVFAFLWVLFVIGWNYIIFAYVWKKVYHSSGDGRIRFASHGWDLLPDGMAEKTPHSPGDDVAAQCVCPVQRHLVKIKLASGPRAT